MKWVPDAPPPSAFDAWADAQQAVTKGAVFSTTSSAAWAPVLEGVQSAAIGNARSSSVEMRVSGAGILRFNWKASCERGYADEAGNPVVCDALLFSEDGAVKHVLDGVGGDGNTNFVEVTVTTYGTGVHTYKWMYTKDASVSMGDDRGWIDDVRWTPILDQVTVTLNANGGNLADGTTSTGIVCKTGKTYIENFGSNYVFPEPARDGYAFGGWYTESAGGVKVTKYDDVPPENKTFYARWVALYETKFDANGGTGVMNAVTNAYGRVWNLSPNAFKRDGYAFEGWAETADAAEKKYADRAAVSNLTTGASVTLYAKWAKDKYTVAFDANGGEGTMEGMALEYDDKGTDLPKSTFTRKGYAFGGWALTPDGAVKYADGATVSNLTTEAGAEVTLYAAWVGNAYTVKFDANGGGGSKDMDPMNLVYDVKTNLTACGYTPPKADQVFSGWAETADGKVKYANGALVSKLTETAGGVVTLYAVWESGLWPDEKDGPFAFAAAIYDGWLLDAKGVVQGTVQVKTTRGAPDKIYNDGYPASKVTATIATAEDGKKWSFSKGIIRDEDGVVADLECTTKNVPESRIKDLRLASNGMVGTWNGWRISGARNGMAVAGDPMKDALEKYAASWSVTVGDVRLQLVVGAGGKVKVSGSLANGGKISTTVQGVMGATAFCVPVTLNVKKGSETTPVRLLLRLTADGTETAVVADASNLGAVIAGGKTEKLVSGAASWTPSDYNMVGVAFRGAVTLDELMYPCKFSAKGLPAGLKIDAATGVISGVPTKAAKGSVTVSVKSVAFSGATASCPFKYDIAPLPAWAQGSFVGGVFPAGTVDPFQPDTKGLGSATFTASSAGKISGKVLTGGTSWTLSAASYDSVALDGAGEVLQFTVNAKLKAGKASTNVVFDVKPGVAKANCTEAAAESALGDILLWRNVWKDAGETDALMGWSGVYRVKAGKQLLDITVDEKGNAKAKGSMTASTVLIPVGSGYGAVFYAAETRKAPESFASVLFENRFEKAWTDMPFVATRSKAGFIRRVETFDGGAGRITVSPANGQADAGKTVTLTAKPDSKSVFVGWEYALPDEGTVNAWASPLKLVATGADVEVTAVFRAKAAYTKAPVPEDKVMAAKVGVPFEEAIEVPYADRPCKFTVSGLPSGLKMNLASGVVSGTPKKAFAEKAFTVKVTSGANSKLVGYCTLTIKVDP